MVTDDSYFVFTHTITRTKYLSSLIRVDEVHDHFINNNDQSFHLCEMSDPPSNSGRIKSKDSNHTTH